MIDSVSSHWKATLAILLMAAFVFALPAQAKIEPVRSTLPGLVDLAVQAAPPPGERAPGPGRDDAVLGDGESGVTWAVAIIILLGAIAAVAWWWPKFQRSRTDSKPPVTPSRGPAQNQRDPSDRGH